MSFGLLVVVSWLTLVGFNCENLFDCEHDSLKQDTEWLEGGRRKWTPKRYWQKLRNVAQTIVSCSAGTETMDVPHLVALVEVENDRVLRDLTRRTLLRTAGYDWLMTESPDRRGIDVALVYQRTVFRPICYDCLTVEPEKGHHPTRDILYVKGRYISGDTLHVFVVHAPSKLGGERKSEPWRRKVLQRMRTEADHIRMVSPQAKIIFVGDFNDTADSPPLTELEAAGYHNVSRDVGGRCGQAKASYRYQGHWQGIDHVFVSGALFSCLDSCYVNDAPFLLEKDKKYGGMKPLRTYIGPRFHKGFSDHLPVVARFRLSQHDTLNGRRRK